MLRTYCPECDFPQTIAEASLGEEIPCRGCKHTYIAALPAPEIVEPEPEAPTATATRTARRAKEAKSYKHTKTFLGLLTSSLFTMTLIVGGITYMIATLPVKKASTPAGPQFNNYTPPPVYDGPKKIDDLLNEAPKKGAFPPPPPGAFK